MHILIFFMFLSLLQMQSLHDYSLKTIDGNTINLSDFKGKKILIVNTASECGFTPQYADLEKLANQYKNKLVVIGFPSNDFGGQEPGDNEQISDFCKKNYGVSFLLSEKSFVSGDKQSPVFKYLTQQDNPDFTGAIQWNFEKFLIDEDGKLIHRYRSSVNPLSADITGAL